MVAPSDTLHGTDVARNRYIGKPERPSRSRSLSVRRGGNGAVGTARWVRHSNREKILWRWGR